MLGIVPSDMCDQRRLKSACACRKFASFMFSEGSDQTARMYGFGRLGLFGLCKISAKTATMRLHMSVGLNAALIFDIRYYETFPAVGLIKYCPLFTCLL